jgi:hypothetical protein
MARAMVPLFAEISTRIKTAVGSQTIRKVHSNGRPFSKERESNMKIIVGKAYA